MSHSHGSGGGGVGLRRVARKKYDDVCFAIFVTYLEIIRPDGLKVTFQEGKPFVFVDVI